MNKFDRILSGNIRYIQLQEGLSSAVYKDDRSLIIAKFKSEASSDLTTVKDNPILFERTYQEIRNAAFNSEYKELVPYVDELKNHVLGGSLSLVDLPREIILVEKTPSQNIAKRAIGRAILILNVDWIKYTIIAVMGTVLAAYILSHFSWSKT